MSIVAAGRAGASGLCATGVGAAGVGAAGVGTVIVGAVIAGLCTDGAPRAGHHCHRDGDLNFGADFLECCGAAGGVEFVSGGFCSEEEVGEDIDANLVEGAVVGCGGDFRRREGGADGAGARHAGERRLRGILQSGTLGREAIRIGAV